jgi:glycosyltransferase involved in cell wall biosynthesis
VDIVHVITGLGRGGTESVLCEVATRLHTRDVRSHVVSLTSGGQYGAALAAAGIGVTTLPAESLTGIGTAAIRLASLLRRKKPNVVMTWLYRADFVGSLAAQLAGYKDRLIWNVRCSDMDQHRYNQIRRTLARMSGFPTLIVANSERGRTAHVGFGYRADRWELVPNGVDIDQFFPSADRRARARKLFDVNADAVLFGLVARVDIVKCHDDFLAALDIARARNPNIVGILVGAGTDAYAGRPGIIALGERDDIPDIMAALDALCLVSSSEGFPNVLAEGMASALPCVSTDAGDAAEILGGSGHITPVGDHAAIAGAMQKIASMSVSERQMLGATLRARVIERWSADKMLQQYQTIFSRFVTSSTRRVMVDERARGSEAAISGS